MIFNRARQWGEGLGGERPGLARYGIAKQGKVKLTVYIIRELDSDYFKIGFTEQIEGVEVRRQSLQTGNPRKLVVYLILDGDVSEKVIRTIEVEQLVLF